MTDIDLTEAAPPTGADEVEALASTFVPMGEWVRTAACAGAEPTQFDMPTARNGVVSTKQLRTLTTTALRFCASCPVRTECLRDATDNNLTGLRGGVLVSNTHDRGPLLRDLLAPAVAAA